MIAAHRRAHRRIHAILWPLAAALVAAALATRRPLDPPTDWPSVLAENARANRAMDPSAKNDARLLWSRDEAFGAWSARLALFADDSLELQPRRPIDRPELLLYWVPGAFSGRALPDGARLLGRVTGTHAQRFALPNRATDATDATTEASAQPTDPAAPAEPASLILYSLGHGEIVASTLLVPDGAPASPAATQAPDPAAP